MRRPWQQQSLLPRLGQRPYPVDERWIEAYGNALIVTAYQGICRFELDGIVVTILEPPEKRP